MRNNIPITEYNCAGFAFETYIWEQVWTYYEFNLAQKERIKAEEKNPKLTCSEGYVIELNALIRYLIEKIEFEFDYKQIKVNNISEAPEGCVVMRIRHNVMNSDFHFARKAFIDGEPCWLHKPGKSPIDIMFDDDIISKEWDGGYNSPIVFFIKR